MGNPKHRLKLKLGLRFRQFQIVGMVFLIELIILKNDLYLQLNLKRQKKFPKF